MNNTWLNDAKAQLKKHANKWFVVCEYTGDSSTSFLKKDYTWETSYEELREIDYANLDKYLLADTAQEAIELVNKAKAEGKLVWPTIQDGTYEDEYFVFTERVLNLDYDNYTDADALESYLTDFNNRDWIDISEQTNFPN